MPAASAQLNNFVVPAYAGERPAKPGFFQVLFRALVESRQRQAEREVARLIERGGGRMTDTIERQIERHFV